jgi:hypothetical protein
VTSGPSGIRRVIAGFTTRVRRLLGRVFQVVFHDQIADLGHETERLGAASVESANYLGMELAEIDRRLGRIEEEIASLVEAASSGRPSA